MNIVKTAKLKITSHTKTLEPTLEIYRKALIFYIDVVKKEWDSLKELDNRRRLLLLETISHKTKQHPEVKYNFDKDFYKFPCYLRRACIMEAIGCVESYYSNYERWQKEKEETLFKGKKFHKKSPTLQLKHNSFPVLYKPEMFKREDNGGIKIKVFHNNDWVWIDITIKDKNLLSSRRYRFTDYTEANPKLVKKGKKFYLHIPYEKKVKLYDRNDVAISVDLGLTNSAVVNAMRSDGTVLGRLFINQPKEKDRLNHTINKLSKAKRNSHIIKAPNYWRVINNLQREITQDTANKIVDFALKFNAGVIVFEYLSRMKLPKDVYGAKRLRFKLQYWAKQTTYKKTLEKAHSLGIRLSRVLARGTSMYAFDGSGEVARNSKKDIAVFTTGKEYHADLSASYNTGARYFIRELLRPLPEMVRLQVQAKVPELVVRTQQTLSSLTRLQEALSLNALDTSASRIQDREASSTATA